MWWRKRQAAISGTDGQDVLRQPHCGEQGAVCARYAPAPVDPFANDGHDAGPAGGLEDAKDHLGEDEVPQDMHVPEVAEAEHAGEDAVAFSRRENRSRR